MVSANTPAACHGTRITIEFEGCRADPKSPRYTPSAGTYKLEWSLACTWAIADALSKDTNKPASERAFWSEGAADIGVRKKDNTEDRTVTARTWTWSNDEFDKPEKSMRPGFIQKGAMGQELLLRFRFSRYTNHGNLLFLSPTPWTCVLRGFANVPIKDILFQLALPTLVSQNTETTLFDISRASGYSELVENLQMPNGEDKQQMMQENDAACAELRNAAIVSYGFNKQSFNRDAKPSDLIMPFGAFINVELWTDQKVSRALVHPCTHCFAVHARFEC